MLLTIAGSQVPTILLVEVVGNIGAVVPAHIGGIAAKVVVVLGNTVVVSVTTVVAHCPAAGVKI